MLCCRVDVTGQILFQMNSYQQPMGHLMSCATLPLMGQMGGLLLGLSHGKAVIASNISHFREKEQQGALITFKDVDDLADKIKLLLRNEAERYKLEDAATKYAYENRWEIIARKHISLFTEVINQCQ